MTWLAPLRRPAATRLSWSVVDHGVASVSNLLLMLLAARWLTAAEFGVVVVGFTTYQLCLGVHRALVSEPILVATTGDGGLAGAARSASASAMGVAVPLSIVVACSGTVVGGSVSGAMWCVALALPWLALQDTCRYIAFRAGQPRTAARMDVTWLILEIALVTGIWAMGETISGGVLLAIWGVAGGVSALLGARLVGAVVRFDLTWVRDHAELGVRYVSEFLLVAGSSLVTLLVLAPLSGLQAAGAVRGAQVFFGPLNILFAGVLAFAVPEGLRLKHDAVRFRSRLQALSLGLAVIAVASTICGLLLPMPVGEAFFGESWPGIRSILLPSGVAALAGSAMAGAIAGLRAIRAARESLRVRVLTAPLLVLGPILGALFGGLQGYAWTSAVAACVAAAAWWGGFGRATVAPADAQQRHPGAALRPTAQVLE